MLEKVNLNQVLAIGIVGLAINVMFYGCGKSSTINRLQDDTDSTMAGLKAESSILGVEAGRSQAASIEVKESVDRINGNINDCRGRINDLQASINELERTLAECATVAGKNKSIIDEVDKSN